MRTGPLLLLLLTSPAVAAPAVLTEDLPAGYLLDGRVTEWTRPPDVLVGPDGQVAGDPGGGPEDLSARVWYTVLLDGLLVAGEITDDALFLPATRDQTPTSDHVSLWIALPAAELPPIGFEGAMGPVTLRGPADCASAQGVNDTAACEAWFVAQPPHRARLAQLFIRQYLLSPVGVLEAWSGNCAPRPDTAPDLQAAICRSSTVKVERTATGWSFEAKIGLQDFPATHDNPMSHLRLMVEVMDNDAGVAAPEATYASPKDAEPTRPESLPRWDLLRPPLYDSNPPLFASLDLVDPQPGLFFYPSLKLTQAYTLENLATPGQVGPTVESPHVTPLDWSKPRRVTTLGDLAVYEVPGKGAGCVGCPPQRRLVVVRGDQVLTQDDLGGGAVRYAATRGDAVHLLVLEDRTTPEGLTHLISVLALDASGALTEVFDDELTEGHDEDAALTYQGVAAQASADLNAFGFSGQKVLDAAPDKAVGFTRIHQWNPGTGGYTEGQDMP